MEAKEGEEAAASAGGLQGGTILYEMVNETWDAVERCGGVSGTFVGTVGKL